MKFLLPAAEFTWSKPPVNLPDYDLPGQAILLRSGLAKKDAEALVANLDRYILAFKTYLPKPFAKQDRLVVHIFASEETFRESLTKAYGRNVALRDACYSPTDQETKVSVRVEGSNFRLVPEVMRHELIHHALRFYFGRDNLPIWLDEGFACYFQNWDISKPQAENLRNIPRRVSDSYFGYFAATVRTALADGSLKSAEGLLGLDYATYHRGGDKVERLHYSQSWAMICALIETPDGIKMLNMVMDAIAASNKNMVLDPDLVTRLDVYYKAYIKKTFR